MQCILCNIKYSSIVLLFCLPKPEVVFIMAGLLVVDRAVNQLKSLSTGAEQRARGSCPAVQLEYGGPWRRRDVFMVRICCQRTNMFSGVRGAATKEEEQSFLPDHDEVPQHLRQTAPASARRAQQQHAVHDPLPDRERDQTHLQQLPGSRAAAR